jgi:O-acetyl-ADP-ribose deacetylase (regulator of RNase III)
MSEKRIHLELGDITKLKVDAIVNAANPTLLGGGGVDGAIHRAAGSELLEECKLLNGCETGEAKITKGYNLQAKFVIHTVGPVWHGGNNDEHKLLSNCYKNSLTLAKNKEIKIIAFPAISTGIFGFPSEIAANIAVKSVKEFLNEDPSIKQVIFVCFDQQTFNIYKKLI